MNYCYSQQLGRNLLASRGDADALAYVAAVRAAGGTVSGAQQTAINTFYVDAKAGSYYTPLKRLYLPIWGVAAANAIDMIGLTSGTFNGSVTHASGYVQGDGATGYFNLGASPSTLGLTTSSAMIGFLRYAGGTGVSIPIGASESSPTNLFIVDINGTTLNTANQNAGDSLSESLTPLTGIIMNNRSSNTVVKRHRLLSGTFTSATGNSAAATLGPPTGNLYALARNNDGSALNLDNSKLGGYWASAGLSDTLASNFASAMATLWTTCTGLSLP